MRNRVYFFFGLIVLITSNCIFPDHEPALFTVVPLNQSQIQFENKLTENEEFNYFTFAIPKTTISHHHACPPK